MVVMKVALTVLDHTKTAKTEQWQATAADNLISAVIMIALDGVEEFAPWKSPSQKCWLTSLGFGAPWSSGGGQSGLYLGDMTSGKVCKRHFPDRQRTLE